MRWLVILIAGCTADTLGLTDPNPSDAEVTNDAEEPGRVTDYVRACTFAASCGGGSMRPDEVVSISNCLDLYAQRDWPIFSNTFGHGPDRARSDLLVECAGRAGSCAELESCVGGDLFGFGSCEVGGRCRGSALVVGSEWFDCGRIDGTCVETPVGVQTACCRPNDCGASECGLFCAEERQGGGFAYDCAASGRTCDEDDVVRLCDGTGPPCASPVMRCDGSVAVHCIGVEHQVAFDCKSTGLRTACVPVDAAAFPCVPARSECDPSTFAGRCDGERVIACVDGEEVGIDCQQIGQFEVCHDFADGPAHCGFLLD